MTPARSITHLRPHKAFEQVKQETEAIVKHREPTVATMTKSDSSGTILAACRGVTQGEGLLAFSSFRAAKSDMPASQQSITDVVSLQVMAKCAQLISASQHDSNMVWQHYSSIAA